MLRATIGLWMMIGMLWAGMAVAQQQAWVQVEAQPTLAEAQERARAYTAAFPDVEGYQLGSRWYGIVLGPYPPAEAAQRLSDLLRENLIPRDSYITDGANFRSAFWPDGTVAPPAAPAVAPTVSVETPQAPAVADIAPPEPVDETPAEARRSEATLTPEERADLQRALQWEGFYGSAIDGAFGPGTRKSMADWQSAMQMEPTGILTSLQRATLVANWRADLADYGFETVTETESGIEITLPLALVGFDHYEPPFVHFAPKAKDGMRVILISQPGDKAALQGLYDILQTLTILPTEGARSLGEQSFEINGTSATTQSHAFAEIRQGLIKGYILVWSPEQADRASRVLGQMKASFRPLGNRALDPGMVPMTDAARRGLLAGLETRRPVLSRSGFFVDSTGHVATTVEAVQSCGRITLDSMTDATVVFADAATGVALLAPATPLAPQAFAGLQITPDRIGAEIAVAGYSYEDALPAPVMTFGVLEDVKGLDGEVGVKRLAITTRPGDAGGPVIDGTGAVLGMLLPRATGGSRILPDGVEFATAAAVLAQGLTQQGITVTQAPAMGALAPEDLTRKATGMTVLVSCWE